MQTYQIQINEQQRAIIASALAALNAATPGFEVDSVAGTLQGMFDDLPADELEQQTIHGCKPGHTLHGFCL